MTVALPGGQIRHVSHRSRVPGLAILSEKAADSRTDGYCALSLTQNSPLLIVEYVRESALDEAYIDKRAQYEARKVGEYWIVDCDRKRVSVFTLTDHGYIEACYQGVDQVLSRAFPTLALRACEMLPIEDYKQLQ